MKASRHTRRPVAPRGGRAGLTLVELMAAVPLLASLLLLMHQTASLATRSSEHARAITADVGAAARLEATLGRFARTGALLDGLSIVPGEGLVAGPAPPAALFAWAPPAALVIRALDRHEVVGKAGEALVRWTIGADGQVTREVLAQGVLAARFALERDAAGRPLGVSWDVRTRVGASSGFAAVRVTGEPAGPSVAEPPTAPRWTRGAR